MKMAMLRARAWASEKLGDLWQAAQHHPWRAAALLPVLALLYVLVLIPFTPGVGDIRKAKTEAHAVVLSADGKELAVFRRANREWAKLADISPNVVAALIATEDHRFYQHHGIDFKRTLSAMGHTLTGSLQGGSTITQQLARNLYPEEIGRAASITRKVKEAITAFKIEAVYTKPEILETYLNTVPFLYNANGIEMAARTYFDKSADALDVVESATLIGMLKGTSYYNPVLNPERALQRRNTVLEQMAKHQKIDAARLVALKKTPLKLDFERQTEQLGPAPHFTQQLRRWLIDWADRNDHDIYADGLVVRTTIDSRLQDFANAAVERQGDRLQVLADAQWGARSGWGTHKDMVNAFVRESAAYRTARGAGLTEAQALKQVQDDGVVMARMRQDKTRLEAGFLALDPRTGHVKAWVGSRDFSDDQFDHVQQAKRQPGSTFKPFVYGAAFEQGARPTDVLMDQALEIRLDQKTVWRPSDGGAPSGNAISLRDGLAYSKNTITAQVMQSVGPARVARLARAMGVRQSRLDEVLSLALGTSPVTLKEMVTAYGSIANGGSYIEPVLVTRIEDSKGRVLETFAAPEPEPAMSRAGAETLLDAMRGVVDRGTGTAIRTRFGIQADVAGKTGTTQNNTDGWFILMHPELVAGAWVGFNDNRVTMGNRWGPGAQSALPMVGDFFQHAIKVGAMDAHLQFSAPQVPGLVSASVDEAPVESSDSGLSAGAGSELAPGQDTSLVPSPQPPPQLITISPTGRTQVFPARPTPPELATRPATSPLPSLQPAHQLITISPTGRTQVFPAQQAPAARSESTSLEVNPPRRAEQQPDPGGTPPPRSPFPEERREPAPNGPGATPD